MADVHGHRLPPLPPETYVCDACAFDYAATSVHAAVEAIRVTTAGIAATTLAANEVRRRPEPQCWSIVEYVCHVRDVLSTSLIRLHRTMVDDDPQWDPMFNDLRAERLRYGDAELAGVLDELARSAQGFAEEVAWVRPDRWQRTGSRDANDTRTALWLVRHAAHECQHHLADIRDVAERVAANS